MQFVLQQGLNINGGGGRTSEIKIRLRPHKSNSSFFPYEHLIGTMLHELVHNVQGPHNAVFYKLLDEITEVLVRLYLATASAICNCKCSMHSATSTCNRSRTSACRSVRGSWQSALQAAVLASMLHAWAGWGAGAQFPSTTHPHISSRAWLSRLVCIISCAVVHPPYQNQMLYVQVAYFVSILVSMLIHLLC